MTRWLGLLAVVFTGCLSPGSAPYGRLDDGPPTVLSIDPSIGLDAGVPTINGGTFISITFSEQMDVDSLRPGIVVRSRSLVEEPLSIQLAADPTPVRYSSGVDGGLRDLPMTVQITSAAGGFEHGTYQLILRTLLIDRAGNSLSSEFLGAFNVN